MEIPLLILVMEKLLSMLPLKAIKFFLPVKKILRLLSLMDESFELSMQSSRVIEPFIICASCCLYIEYAHLFFAKSY